MQKFKSHKVVEAAKIVSIIGPAGDTSILLENALGFGCDLKMDVSDAWVERFRPEEGGYYVRYSDGYESFSPAAAFEEGYTRADVHDPKNGALPVAGYQPQTQEKVDLVNSFKADEERLLRNLDGLKEGWPPGIDQRWLAIGRTQLEQAFMAINRSVFRPKRCALPEDVRKGANIHGIGPDEANGPNPDYRG